MQCNLVHVFNVFTWYNEWANECTCIGYPLLHVPKTVVEPCCFIAFSNLFRQDSDSKQPEDLPPRTMDLVSGGLAHYLCVAHVGSLPVFASTKVFGCRLVIRAGAATYWQPCYTLSSDYFPICSYFHIFSPIRTLWISWAPATQLTWQWNRRLHRPFLQRLFFQLCDLLAELTILALEPQASLKRSAGEWRLGRLGRVAVICLISHVLGIGNIW